MPERANAAVDPRFPAMLRGLRQRAGLSLRALATASNYSRSYLWDLEAGHKHPSPAVAGRLDATLVAGGALVALVSTNSARAAWAATPVSSGPHRSAQADRARHANGDRAARTTIPADARRRSRPHHEIVTAESGTERASNARPDVNRPRPDAGNVRPDASRPRPDAGNSRPDASRPRPDTNNSRPDATEPPPDTNNSRPDATKPPPDTNNARRPTDERRRNTAPDRATINTRPVTAATGRHPAVDDAIAHWHALARAHPATEAPADPAAARIEARTGTARRWALIAEPPPRAERFDPTRYATSPTTPTAWDGAGTRPVTGPDTHTIRRLVATFRELDNRHGGAHVHPPLVRFLDLEVAPLLAGRYDPSTGRDLAAAAAEAVLLAGWAAYDAGLDTVAQRHLGHALDLARLGGDRALEAETLVAMAHHCAYHGFGLPSVDLARRAGQAAAEAGAHAVWAEAAAQEAHGYAIHGDAAACAQALDRAEDAIHRADRSHDVDWMRHIDLAYLKARAGVCFIALHRPDLTARYVGQLERAATPFRRAGAIRAVVAATAHARIDSVERACELGFEALRAGADVRSARLVRFMVGLGEALHPHREVPVVRDFLSRAALD